MFMNRESLARCLVGVATPQREQYIITYVYPGTYLSALFHLISVSGMMPLLTV